MRAITDQLQGKKSGWYFIFKNNLKSQIITGMLQKRKQQGEKKPTPHHIPSLSLTFCYIPFVHLTNSERLLCARDYPSAFKAIHGITLHKAVPAKCFFHATTHLDLLPYLRHSTFSFLIAGAACYFVLCLIGSSSHLPFDMLCSPHRATNLS